MAPPLSSSCSKETPLSPAPDLRSLCKLKQTELAVKVLTAGAKNKTSPSALPLGESPKSTCSRAGERLQSCLPGCVATTASELLLEHRPHPGNPERLWWGQSHLERVALSRKAGPIQDLVFTEEQYARPNNQETSKGLMNAQDAMRARTARESTGLPWDSGSKCFPTSHGPTLRFQG